MDLNRDGFNDILISSITSISIYFGEKDFHLGKRDENHFYSPRIIIGDRMRALLFALHDFDNDSIPEFSSGSFIISGNVLKDYFPPAVENMDHLSKKNLIDHFHSPDIFTLYIKPLIIKMLMMIVMLLLGLLLFLWIRLYERPSSSSTTTMRMMMMDPMQIKTGNPITFREPIHVKELIAKECDDDADLEIEIVTRTTIHDHDEWESLLHQ